MQAQSYMQKEDRIVHVNFRLGVEKRRWWGRQLARSQKLSLGTSLQHRMECESEREREVETTFLEMVEYDDCGSMALGVWLKTREWERWNCWGLMFDGDGKKYGQDKVLTIDLSHWTWCKTVGLRCAMMWRKFDNMNIFIFFIFYRSTKVCGVKLIHYRWIMGISNLHIKLVWKSQK